MSGFDKEAERERLREKYERDQKKREATQRMSELLLQGATMTNKHCDECGDPLFRYEGQEFCPTCHTTESGEVDAESASEAEATPAEDGASAAEASGEATAAAESTPPEQPVRTAESRGEQPTPASEAEPPTPTPTHPAQPTTQRAETSAQTSAQTQSGASIDSARASLVRTLNRYAQEAENTDDPRRAQELLAAAREAAEALSALER